MGKVLIISEQRAKELDGKTYAPDSYFFPIQDANDNWCISKEEADYLDTSKDEYSEFQDLKSLTPVDLQVKNISLSEAILINLEREEKKKNPKGETPKEETIKPK